MCLLVCGLLFVRGGTWFTTGVVGGVGKPAISGEGYYINLYIYIVAKEG